MAQVYTFTDSNGEVRLMAEINPAPGGSVAVATISLTHTQILALPTAPQTVVGAPGLTKMLWPLAAYLFADTTAAAYTNIDANAALQIVNGVNGDTLLGFFSASGVIVDGVLAAGAYVMWDVPALGDIDVANHSTQPLLVGGGDPPSLLADKPLVLQAVNHASGDYTGGDAANKLAVTVIYVTLDIP